MGEFSSRLLVRVDGLGEPEFDMSFGPGPFGADFSLSHDVLKAAQAKINALGYVPPLVVDGIWGPKTAAGVVWARRLKGAGGAGLDDAALTALGISPAADDVPVTTSDSVKRPTRAVAIATMARALRQAASDLGHPLSDNLLAMMLGQKLTEGAMPGLSGGGYTFAGTNNAGAAQIPGGVGGQAWAAARKTVEGWGAFAHRDTNPPGPNGGPYIGWYYIAPNVYESAKQWLTGYAGTKNVLAQNPQSPEDYARIMYNAHYFTGTSNDSAKEIAAYANGIRRNTPSKAAINGVANDPKELSVDPSQFRSIGDRKLTKDLFDQAKSGKSGGSWAFLLPDSWDDFVKANGVVWFGPAPAVVASLMKYSPLSASPEDLARTAVWVVGGAVVGGVVAGLPGVLIGAFAGGAAKLYFKYKK